MAQGTTPAQRLLPTTRAHLALVDPVRAAEVIDRLAREDPELLQMADDVDFSLVEYMLALQPSERLDSARNMALLWAAGQDASQSR